MQPNSNLNTTHAFHNQLAPWLQSEPSYDPPKLKAPLRTSSLNPESDLLNQLEKMNAKLRSDPNAVTSVLVADASVSNANANSKTDDSEHAQIAFYLSVLESLEQDKNYLAKIDALIKAKVRLGVPEKVRTSVWKALAFADVAVISQERYDALVDSDARGFDKIIKQDIHRTFPDHPLFSSDTSDSPGQKSLYNILKAYAVFDSDCGYCQGLSFLVAPLLMQPEMSDLDAFRIFTRIMDESVTTGGKRFALRSLFTPDMPGLHLLLHQLEGLVRTYLPALYARLQLLGITASTYASPWFLTLFTYSFPLPLVFRIYDLILSEGAVIMMLKIGLALLRRNEPVILAMGEEDFEPVLEVLKGKGILGVYYGHEVEGVIKDAALLDSVVTESALTKLTASYFEQKQISSTSMLEIQTLRAKVDFVTMQNEALYQDNVNLKATLSKVNKERISDMAEIQRQCEVKIASAMAVAELEKKKRVELEKELKLLKQKMSKAEILGDSW